MEELQKNAAMQQRDYNDIQFNYIMYIAVMCRMRIQNFSFLFFSFFFMFELSVRVYAAL